MSPAEQRLFSYWLHQVAFPEERALAECEQRDAFLLWKRHRDNWRETKAQLDQVADHVWFSSSEEGEAE